MRSVSDFPSLSARHHPLPRAASLPSTCDTLLIRCEVDSEMEPSDYRVMGIGCDVSSELSVQQAFRRVMDTYGRVDSVVASAGSSSPPSVCGAGQRVHRELLLSPQELLRTTPPSSA